MRRFYRIAGLLAITAFAAGCASLGSRGPHVVDADEMRRLEARSAAEPANPHWSCRIGEAHEARGDLASAETALRSALARDPGHAPSLSLLSKIYYDTGRHEEAVALLEANRASMPGELMAALALHYEALDRFDEAAELVASLEKSLSNWQSAGSAVAFLRLRGDDFSNALDVTRRALDAEPSAVNHNNHGISLLYSGDPKAARKSFLTARKLDGDLPGALYNLAIVDWFYFFDAEGARQWFQQYQKLSEEDPDGLAEILTADATSSAPGNDDDREETE